METETNQWIRGDLRAAHRIGAHERRRCEDLISSKILLALTFSRLKTKSLMTALSAKSLSIKMKNYQTNPF